MMAGLEVLPRDGYSTPATFSPRYKQSNLEAEGWRQEVGSKKEVSTRTQQQTPQL